jgi:indole-3-glycerol phosphate synthase
MGVLDEIVAHKRSELAELKPRRPLPELIAACRGLAPARDFEAALRPAAGERVRLIAEVKRGSPSQGLFRADLDPVAQAGIYAGAGAAAVSVLTDARYFHGSLADLVSVRAAVSVPVLRKEFIVDEYRVGETYADVTPYVNGPQPPVSGLLITNVQLMSGQPARVSPTNSPTKQRNVTVVLIVTAPTQ